MNFLLSIGLSLIVGIIGAFGVYNYAPLNLFEFDSRVKLGATITTINSTDTISSSRTVINDNFTNLNNGKTEVSSSSIAAITTLANLTSAAALATVGTLTTGSLGSGFTAVVVGRGGTGSTTLSANQVLLGSTTNAVNVVSGWGTSGQLLTSNGAGLAPTWGSPTVDTAINYTWTGVHGFGSSTPAARVGIQGNLWTSGTINAGTVNATSSLTVGSVSGSIGIGTTTPARNLGVQGEAFISGTTTTGNLVATSSVWINAIRLVQSFAYSSSTAALGAGTYDDVRTLNFTPRALSGSAFFTSNTNSNVACSFSWSLALGNVHTSTLINTGSGSGDTTNLCKGDQATDDARIFVQDSGVGTITFRLVIGAGVSTLSNISAVIVGN